MSKQLCDRPLVLLLSCVYGGLFLVILYGAYNGNLPNWFQGIPHYDKPAHVGLYAIATYLGHRLLGGKCWHLRGLALPRFPILFGLFTTAEELFQGLAPHRTLDALDLICSLVGVWLGHWLAERALAKASSSSLASTKQ